MTASTQMSLSCGVKRILLLENISQKAMDSFTNAGYEVISKSKLSPEELIEIIPNIDVIGIRSKTQLPKEILQAAKRLTAIGCFCIGTDQVDLKAASTLGIPVFNAPFANTRSVAEIVVACIIGLSRGLPDKIQQMHRGEWKKTSQGMVEVRGKVLGIIGYGHVGSQLSVLAEALGMNVIFYDVERKLPLGNASSVDSLQTLLRQSQFVSLHVPMTERTDNMIGAQEIAEMQERSFLINFARGKVCDTNAVAEALRRGHLAGAAFDVYPSEPAHGEAFENALMHCPNTILTPHIGGSTEEAQATIGVEVSAKLIQYIQRGSTKGACNFPIVALLDKPCAGESLLTCVHHNVPGVLRDINNIISDHNVSAQMLCTHGDIGYLVCRVGTSDSTAAGHKIASLPYSIRTRIIQEAAMVV